MAGGISIDREFATSKLWHQNQSKNDYDDMVIVPRSILVDTADAIRAKRDGTTTITVNDNGEITSNNGIEPEDFATEINDLGYIPSASDLVFTGDLSNKFYSGFLWWVIRNYKDKITTSNVSNALEMFKGNSSNIVPDPTDLSSIILNFQTTTSGSSAQSHSIDDICSNFNYLVKPPKITGTIGSILSGICDNCYLLEEPFDFSNCNFVPYTYGQCNFDAMYRSCRILNADIDLGFIPYEVATFYSNYISAFCRFTLSGDYCVSGLLNIPVLHHGTSPSTVLTNNFFSQCCEYCLRLSRFTFQLDANNQPYTAYWKEVVIDLSNYVGYCSINYAIQYLQTGTGIDIPVSDATTYNQMKNNPNWWSTSLAYSRYNHTSAVETINTLPDVSNVANGTNTIKFKAGSGNSTDGGGIDDLTSAEIAVATAKGWTVSIV